MPLTAHIPRAAKRYALVKQNVITDFGSLANHHACSVIDKDAFTDFRPRMNLDACQETCNLRYEPRENISFATVEPMRHAMEHNDVQTRITKKNLEAALCRW